MKQDTNLGWTSYDFKSAPMATEDICKGVCSSNPKCDFYAFIDSVNFKCWCGEYKVPSIAVPLNSLASVSEVTLKYKNGE